MPATSSNMFAISTVPLSFCYLHPLIKNGNEPSTIWSWFSHIFPWKHPFIGDFPASHVYSSMFAHNLHMGLYKHRGYPRSSSDLSDFSLSNLSFLGRAKFQTNLYIYIHIIFVCLRLCTCIPDVYLIYVRISVYIYITICIYIYITICIYIYILLYMCIYIYTCERAYNMIIVLQTGLPM